MGCPTLSSMEIVKISHVIATKEVEGFDVCIDKNTYEADDIIVLNRIKAHTGFEVSPKS